MVIDLNWTEEEYAAYETKKKIKSTLKTTPKSIEPKLKESEIQSQVKGFLQLQGWFVFKNHQSLGSYKGIADLYAIKGGMGVWIEIKTQSGKQSQDQFEFEKNIKYQGGKYIVVRSLKDIQDYIK